MDWTVVTDNRKASFWLSIPELKKQSENALSPRATDDELFEREFRRVNLGEGDNNGSSSHITSEGNHRVIAKFFTELPLETDEIGQKLREEARAQFLQVSRSNTFLRLKPCEVFLSNYHAVKQFLFNIILWRLVIVKRRFTCLICALRKIQRV